MRKDLLLMSAMFCSGAAFAETEMSVYQGSDVSVRVVTPNTTKLKFAVKDLTVVNSTDENFAKVDSIVLNHYVSVKFDGDKVVVSNPFDSVDVKVSGTTVGIESHFLTREVQYKFSGKSSNGNVIFSSLYKSKFEFNGLELTSEGVNPPIYVMTKKNTEVMLVGENTLKNSSKDTVGATMRGKGQFEFKGDGSLDITSVVGHGIQSSDYVEVKNGKITIDAASDGIHVNDYYTQSGGEVKINTKADGVDVGEGYAEITGGQFTVSSSSNEARGIRCSKTDAENSGNIDIKGGNVDIQLSGEGSRGLKADGNVTVDGADVLVVMSGQALVTTADTVVTCGVKADGKFTVESGNAVVICQSTAKSSRCVQADEAIYINGGMTALYQKSTEKVKGAKKSNVAKSSGNLVVKKTGLLYVSVDPEYTKPYNVNALFVNGTSVDLDDDDELSDYIMVTPDNWSAYEKYDK